MDIFYYSTHRATSTIIYLPHLYIVVRITQNMLKISNVKVHDDRASRLSSVKDFSQFFHIFEPPFQSITNVFGKVREITIERNRSRQIWQICSFSTPISMIPNKLLWISWFLLISWSVLEILRFKLTLNGSKEEKTKPKHIKHANISNHQ